MRTHVLGLFFGIFIVGYSALHVGDTKSTFVDWLSLLIVLGGSISVSIMTNGLWDTIKIFGLFFKVFATNKYNNLKITTQLVEIAQKHYFGTLNLKNISKDEYHPLVLDGLKLIHNKFEPEKFVTLMNNMLQQRQNHYDKMVEKIETLAKYPPAFGMMGTIIGLVAVLKQINSPNNMESIGPSMAVALITTLYGILLSNYLLQPIADNLEVRGKNDLHVRKLIVEGMVLIAHNHDPIFVRESLLSLLTPEERDQFTASRLTSIASDEVAA